MHKFESIAAFENFLAKQESNIKLADKKLSASAYASAEAFKEFQKGLDGDERERVVLSFNAHNKAQKEAIQLKQRGEKTIATLRKNENDIRYEINKAIELSKLGLA